MRIAIIGAGLSGRLLALNLRRHAASAVSITTIDRDDSRFMGPAYSDQADYLPLNVPAGRMGAFSDDPEHFLRWVRQTGVRAGEWDFLPRRLYRDYVIDLLQQVQRERGSGPQLEQVRGEVTDIQIGGDGAAIHWGAAEPFVVDKAVLALGNFPPRHPPVTNRRALESRRYVRNPWIPGVLGALSPNDTVLLVGTGQTTVDLAVALNKRAHKGRIVAVSRHGALPLAHRGFERYSSFVGEIEDSTKILDILRTVRKHMERAASIGLHDPWRREG